MKKRSSIFKSLIITMLFVLSLTLIPTTIMVSAQTNINNTNKNVILSEPEQQPGEEPGEEIVKPVPPADLGVIISNDRGGIIDTYLYQNLCKAYNTYYGFTTKDDGYLTRVYTNMFKDFTELDLSNTNYLITSLQGLGDLDLENLKVLNVGKNEISEVLSDDLKNLVSLEELILYDNKLTQITIPTSLQNLKKINLNKNYISKIDLSAVYNGEVYLSFNKFTSIYDVTLPRIFNTTNLYVELFNNNILDADDVYNAEYVEGAQVNIELGLQGYGLNYKVNDNNEDKVTPIISKSTALKFYNTNKYPNMEVRIYNKQTNELVKAISNSASQKISTYKMGVGEYKVEYYNSETNENMYNYKDEFGSAFKQHEGFKVVPTSPSVKLIIKGVEYDEYGKFSGTAKAVATNLDDEGEIYYSIAGGEWKKGTEVELKRGGTYDISFKCVIGEIGSDSSYESAATSKFVQQSLNPYIPDFVMIIIVAVVALILFGVALPLIIKISTKR